MPTATKPRVKVAPIFLKQKAIQNEKESEWRTMLRRAYSHVGCAAFVSSSLEVIRKGNTHIVEDVLIDDAGIHHYRLTPITWAWLNHMFANATKACAAGKLDGALYEQLLNRISDIYNMAIAQYGRHALKSAEQTFTPRNWKRHVERIESRMPCDASEYAEATDPAHRHPSDGTGAFRPVTGAAVAQVDAIRDKAISLGWNMDQLYRNVGMAHCEWGLVYYLGPVDRIGTITRQSIEIIHGASSGAHSLHFYNQNVEQPWMRFTGKEAAR